MTDTTDRELLRLAAKAAGFDGQWTPEWRAMANGRTKWNPLEDDGDALRLAVKLQLCVEPEWFPGEVCAWPVNAMSQQPCREPAQPDIAAATRRAIVRAAATLAKEQS